VADRSLKFYPNYLRWEVLWSRSRQERVRFVRWEDGRVRVATLNGIRELPDLLEPGDVCRASART
jgi:hypothetical protein